jgi:hypothetical protein
VAAVATALAARGFTVQRCWLDPYDPRDATIRCANALALVWDEETGWRQGQFVSGAPGERTVLAQPTALGGGLLPEPAAVAYRLLHRQTGAAQVYRSFHDLRDGLDDALRTG